MDWTNQQLDAIQERGRSIIVSAAAGSGKTAVLVERLLQILSDPSPDTRVAADEMVVVTFTKDAAAQMKQRLTKKISETLDEMNRNGQHQEATYDWLLQQRSALSNAKISTIHSFCFDFIRENAEACGVSSQFGIAEPAREYVFRKRALQSVIESWTRDRKKEMALLFATLCTRDDSEIEEFVLLTAEYMNSLAFPEYWMQKARKIWEKSAFLDALRQTAAAEIQECIAMAEKCEPFSKAAYSEATDMRYEQIRKNDIANFQACLDYVLHAGRQELLADPLKKEGSFDKFTTFTGGSKKQKNGKSKKEEYYDEDSRTVFKNIRSVYQKKYDTLLKKLLSPLAYWENDEAVLKQAVPVLLELTEAYQAALLAEKKKQNVLSFDDAEHLVLHLLGSVDENGILHRSELAEAVSEKYEFIMIDEYQDSNDKQDCLFKLLSRNCRFSEDGKKLHYGTNAFLVGDIKQSIYSFRQANPENFKRAIQESTMLAECQGQDMARIYLNQNFRSAAGILEFTNEMFRFLMSEQCGGLQYDVNEQLNFGAKIYLELEKQYQGVQIIVPSSGKEETDSFTLQAECLADTIQNMIAQEFPVMQSDKTVRPCQYKDFCILMRSVNKLLPVLGKAFQKRGMPFSYDDNNFLEFPEIKFIINLLKVIDNPMTDIAMAGVLLSPVYGFMPEDLAMLKVSGSGKRIYLQMQSLTEQKDSALAQKSALFLEQLSEMRMLSDTMPLEKFIYEIYDMTDLFSLQSLYEHADERRNHLEVFAQYAQDYREHADINAQSSLSGYIRYLDYLGESGEPISAKMANQKADYIAVKTIHRSKGLEYPFIFLINTERMFSAKPSSDILLADETGLLGMQMLDKTDYTKFYPAVYEYLLYLRNKQEKSEEMRLLYVALTRAKQKLFLITDEIYTGCSPKGHLCNTGDFLADCPSVVAEYAAAANSMQDWILAYLFAAGEADYLRTVMDTGKNIDSSLVEYRFWKMQSNTETVQKQKTEISAVPDTALIQKMQQQLAYQYDTALTKIPSKRTVTSLSHYESSQEKQAKLPDFMLEDEEGRIHRLQGAARGTAIHKIMQFMNFQAAAENLSQEMERMQNTQILETVEAEAIQPQKIQAFFRSDLYRRIAASDSVMKEKQLFVQIGKMNLPENSVLRKEYAGTDGIMIGTVDLIFHEPDGWVIVDYKTDYQKNAEYYTEKYALQLGLYQKAMELLLNAPVKQAYIYAFTIDKAIEINLSEIEYQTAETEDI